MTSFECIFVQIYKYIFVYLYTNIHSVYLYIVLLLSVSCPVAVILLHCGALSL